MYCLDLCAENLLQFCEQQYIRSEIYQDKNNYFKGPFNMTTLCISPLYDPYYVVFSFVIVVAHLTDCAACYFLENEWLSFKANFIQEHCFQVYHRIHFLISMPSIKSLILTGCLNGTQFNLIFCMNVKHFEEGQVQVNFKNKNLFQHIFGIKKIFRVNWLLSWKKSKCIKTKLNSQSAKCLLQYYVVNSNNVT